MFYLRKILAQEGLIKKSSGPSLKDHLDLWFEHLYKNCKEEVGHTEWADISPLTGGVTRRFFSLYLRDVTVPDEPIMTDPLVSVAWHLVYPAELVVLIEVKSGTQVLGKKEYSVDPLRISVSEISSRTMQWAGEVFESSF